MTCLLIYLIIALGCLIFFWQTGLPFEELYYYFTIGDFVMCMFVLVISALVWPITILYLILTTEI